MKVRYVSLETVFPIVETWASTDEQAITRARTLLRQKLEDNPASLMFSVETQEQGDISSQIQP